MNFKNIFGKNGTYDDIKSDPKKMTLPSLYTRVKMWTFFNKTSILVFAESAIFRSI